ncbi:MAG: biotin--[acetyl-CoA-carboxylase] ligase [Flavobacteriaceae bacterium]|jgi:BirA family biotin operon repressor/biotin-[acetyl-CoA-carboxylase] ligase|nr:biotin--[acetyl-CoA-carboxylase] ligase [Flavobacteriaceae bacterium]
MPLEYFDKISSTNDFIRENLNDFKDNNFSGVYTFNQTRGKGPKGYVWVSEPEKNIALTFCLTDKSLPVNNLSFWVAITVCEFIRKVTDTEALVKWPNDILIHKKKVCGILIEKIGNIFAVGIGINVLQENFETLPKASSLVSLAPKKYVLKDLASNLITHFKENFNLINDTAFLLEKYNSYLFGKDRVLTFKVDDSQINGIIRKVDTDGLLQIEFENIGIKKFRIKEIEFLY